MIKEEKLERNLKYKSYLIITKYIPHFTAFIYVVYTILGLFGIDVIQLEHLVHVSVVSWIYFYLNSLVFRYCYVHRLPLYYIALNELIVVTDAYYTIPVDDFILTAIHVAMIGILLLGYSYYYIKFKMK
jgi:hypothetical protein